MKIGETLRNARENRDLKQTDVALATNISNKVLSSYERNICLPTIENLIILCNYYEISADELLSINQKRPEASAMSKDANKPTSKGNNVRLNEEQKRVLFYYERLNQENKDAIKGLMVTYYKEQEKKDS